MQNIDLLGSIMLIHHFKKGAEQFTRLPFYIDVMYDNRLLNIVVM